MPADDLKWAVFQFKPSRRRERYVLCNQYYDGDHRLAFATEKFRSTFGQLFKEFAENMCPAVVESIANRLVVTGFETNAGKVETEEVPSTIENVPPRQKVSRDDPLAERAWEIWERNCMDVVSNEVMIESVKTGDAYVIVWPNDEMEADIFFNEALRCSVQYDPNNRKKILRGTKIWFDEIEARWKLNVYLPTGIEKYHQREKTVSLADAPDKFQQIDYVPNPYGRVPIFHFPNKTANRPGVSRLKDVIPLQDGLNKAVMDMLVSMEFAAFKQRYVIGMDIEIDDETGEPTDQTAKNYGVDRLLGFPDPETKVGQFDATDLQQFLRVQDKFWTSVAKVTGTPLHYFLITTGDFPSGEAIKSAEGRFIKELGDHQSTDGDTWGQVMAFCLQIEEAGVPDDLEIDTLWEDETPRSESELADTAVKKRAVGVPRSQLLRELGYTDEQVDRFLQEADAEAQAKSELAIKENVAGVQARQAGEGSAQGSDQSRSRQGVTR